MFHVEHCLYKNLKEIKKLNFYKKFSYKRFFNQQFQNHINLTFNVPRGTITIKIKKCTQ